MSAESSIVWDDSAILPALAENRDVLWRNPRTSILIDIRTDAATDADISLVVTGFVTPLGNRTLPAPVVTQTINLSKMNNIYSLSFPYPMRTLRTTAYSPTGARLFFMVFDLNALDKLTT